MKAALESVSSVILAALLAQSTGAESFASWSAKGEKAEKRRDTVAALEDYNSALRLWRKSDGSKAKAKILAARASLYAASGSAQAALQDLSQAVKLDPKTPSYYFRKGRVALDLGRSSDAISDFYKATQLNLGYREAFFYRGVAYERQGDMKFAREDYKTACKLGYHEACNEAARAKAKAALATESQGEQFEATNAPPERRIVEIKKPVRSRLRKHDFQACIESLTSCTDSGTGFADCVKQAQICEKPPSKGCCSQECIDRYHSLIDGGGESEAAAFRRVFSPQSSCASP